MKRIVLLLVGLLLAVAAQAQYFTGFSVVNYRIASAWPTSLRSVKGSVAATVGNTGDTRRLSNIRATVYRKGRAFANGACEPVTFVQGTSAYTLKGKGSLADGVSTWDAIRAAFSFNASEYTIDFSLDITHPDGKVDHVVREGIPLQHYLRRR